MFPGHAEEWERGHVGGGVLSTMDIREKLAAYRASKAKPCTTSSASERTEGGCHLDDSGVEALPREAYSQNRSPSPDVSRVPSPWYMTLLKVLLWFILWALFIEIEFGVPYLIVSALYFIFVSLRGSRRKPWEPSAYSVFNKGCEAIDGTLSGEQIDRELRMGPASVR